MSETSVILFSSAPAKKHRLLPLENMQVFKTKLNRGPFLSLPETLDATYRQEEAVCRTVERCRKEIRRRVEIFFAACAGRIPQFADDLLAGKSRVSAVDFQSRVMPKSDLRLLIRDVRGYIRQEMTQCFGISRLIWARPTVCRQNADIRYIAFLTREYRRTLFNAELAAILGEKAFKKSICAIGLPSLAGDLLDQADIGSALLTLFGCQPDLRLQRRQALIAHVNGLLRNESRHIAIEACQAAARSFYELYDLLSESNRENEINAVALPDGLVGRTA